jgi:hypothetical protein
VCSTVQSFPFLAFVLKETEMRTLASALVLVMATAAHAEEGDAAAWQRYLHSQLDNIAEAFDPEANFRATVDTATETSIGPTQEIGESTAPIRQEPADLGRVDDDQRVQGPLARIMHRGWRV